MTRLGVFTFLTLVSLPSDCFALSASSAVLVHNGQQQRAEYYHHRKLLQQPVPAPGPFDTQSTASISPAVQPLPLRDPPQPSQDAPAPAPRLAPEVAREEALNAAGKTHKLSGPSTGAVLGSVLGVFGAIILIGMLAAYLSRHGLAMEQPGPSFVSGQSESGLSTAAFPVNPYRALSQPLKPMTALPLAAMLKSTSSQHPSTACSAAAAITDESQLPSEAPALSAASEPVLEGHRWLGAARRVFCGATDYRS